MSQVEVVYDEASGRRDVASTPLSHLSVELGHLYMEDFEPGAPPLEEHFTRVKAWFEAAQAAFARPLRGRPRVSTCFLIDDYFTRFSTPAVVVPRLMAAAASAGLRIDYLARESGCATTDTGLQLARLVEERLVPEPAMGTTGSRPPVTESGWLANGRPGSDAVLEAMEAPTQWRPPRQNTVRNHSIYLDVELWSEPSAGARRLWSCPFLAAVWQLLRLGLLRFEGQPVVRPEPSPDNWPERWEDLSALVRLEAAAAPFSAYRTFSVLADRFLSIEHAVRIILDQVEIDPTVLAPIGDRADAEGFRLPVEIIDRINYVFVGGSR